MRDALPARVSAQGLVPDVHVGDHVQGCQRQSQPEPAADAERQEAAHARCGDRQGDPTVQDLAEQSDPLGGHRDERRVLLDLLCLVGLHRRDVEGPNVDHVQEAQRLTTTIVFVGSHPRETVLEHAHLRNSPARCWIEHGRTLAKRTLFCRAHTKNPRSVAGLACSGRSLELHDVVYQVLDGAQVVGIFVRDLDLEFLLGGHDKLDDVQTVVVQVPPKSIIEIHRLPRPHQDDLAHEVDDLVFNVLH